MTPPDWIRHIKHGATPPPMDKGLYSSKESIPVVCLQGPRMWVLEAWVAGLREMVPDVLIDWHFSGGYAMVYVGDRARATEVRDAVEVMIPELESYMKGSTGWNDRGLGFQWRWTGETEESRAKFIFPGDA